MTSIIKSRHSFQRRWLAVIVLPLVLTGCGSDTMTSYDAEKSRIRSALNKEVECIERTRPGGMYMECRSPQESLQLMLTATTGDRPQIDLRVQLWDGKGDVQAASYDFRHVLDAYGFDGADVTKCLDNNGFAEQSATYRVACETHSMSGAGVEAHISQQKSI